MIIFFFNYTATTEIYPLSQPDALPICNRAAVIPPASPGKAIILTSGTTGTPKGASRSQPKSLDPAAALLSRIPLRARERTMIAAPLFHAWGFAQFMLGMGLSSTIVLKRKFDPEATLSLTAQHECTALAVVPVMLQRILELEDEVLDRYDLSKLRVVPVSGSALPAAISNKWMDHFGDNLYNLYGSTEVAWATIATPDRKSTRLNSSHANISYAVFCLKKKKNN